MTDLATEATAELNVWLNSFARVGQEGSTAVRVALRMALRTLADPAKGGRNPALAAAMLAELERRFPAEYVTVAQPQHNVVWHLTDANAQPVEAGRYVAADGDEFLIVRNPEVVYDNRDMPARVRIRWTLVGNVPPVSIGVDYRYLRELVPGWTWTPEYGTCRAALTAAPEVKPPAHTKATMTTWDTNTKHRGDGTRTACGKVGRLAEFRDSYRATCTEGGCLDAWAS
jgi:hypothetical protein